MLEMLTNVLTFFSSSLLSFLPSPFRPVPPLPAPPPLHSRPCPGPFSDWIMGLSWCSLSGFHHVIPFFYSIYFFILLVHRALRDDEACAKKYGADWVKYKKLVPYAFVPGVF